MYYQQHLKDLEAVIKQHQIRLHEIEHAINHSIEIDENLLNSMKAHVSSDYPHPRCLGGSGANPSNPRSCKHFSD